MIDGNAIGITVHDSDVEDVPSVVRLGATPSTAGSDEVGFGG